MARHRSGGPAHGCTVFSGVSAPSGLTRFFVAEHAMCLRGIRGAKSCLVFSVACERVPHAIEQASRDRIHERVWAAFYHSADACCRAAFYKFTAALEIFLHQRRQHRERETRRSYAGAETGVNG